MSELIDYAHPMMMAEKHLKVAHDFLLSKQEEAAIEELYKAVVEVRMAIHSITHTKEQVNAIREQTAPVQARVRNVRRDTGSKKEASRA
jgi:hypothetical protein